MQPLSLLTPAQDDDYGSRGRRPDWLDIDWAAHVHDVGVDGRRVRYADIGSGPPMVCIHGLGASWQCWLEQVGAFASDHRVVMLDLPGFGRSEMPDWEIGMEAYGSFMVRFLDALGIGEAIVVGNSMGGFIGAELSIKAPARVTHLCLVSPALLWQEYRRAKPLVALAQVTEASAASAAAGIQKSARSRPRLRNLALGLSGIRYPHMLARELAHELIHSARRTRGFVPALAALSDYPIREELPQVAAPTLLVWGKHDTLVNFRHAQEIERLIPNCETVLLERTGHVAMVERPARFNALLRDFVERTRSHGAAQAPQATLSV